MGTLRGFFMAAVAIGGATLGWIGGTIYADLFTVPAAYQDGRKTGVESEQLAQKAAQQEARDLAEADRRVKQAEIDAIESDFHQRDALRTAQITALEAALQQEQSDVDQAPRAPGSASVCRPAVPQRLRDVLAPLGRSNAPSRLTPPIPSPALR